MVQSEFACSQLSFREFCKLKTMVTVISTRTPWVLSLYDRFWYLREDYKEYTEPGKVKVPFLSQPPRHYLGAAWYQREIQIPQYLSGPPHRAYARAASLGNDGLA